MYDTPILININFILVTVIGVLLLFVWPQDVAVFCHLHFVWIFVTIKMKNYFDEHIYHENSDENPFDSYSFDRFKFRVCDILRIYNHQNYEKEIQDGNYSFKNQVTNRIK